MSYDPQKELEHCLAREVRSGAVAVALRSLSDLADLLDEHPASVVSISDVHGFPETLRRALDQLRLVDANGRRKRHRGFIVQLGDLVDGRRPGGDYDALMLGVRTCDLILLGNHEAALIDGPRFGGLPDFIAPEVSHTLRLLAHEGKLVAAFASQDVLYTHAGVPTRRIGHKAPSGAAARLNSRQRDFLGRSSDQDPALFAIEPRRGGLDPYGGCLWRDWVALIEDPAPYRQVVGHTPLGRVESDPDGRVFCTDLGGPRVGVSLLLPDGRLVFGSDLLPEDPHAA